MPKIDILGVHVNGIDTDGLHTAIAESISRRSKDIYAYVNINAINIAQTDERFRDFLNRAHVVYCDGEGVRLGAQILGHRLPPRVVLTYWIWELCAFCEKQGFTLFFLGATEQFVEEAVHRVRERFPKINVVGSHHGFFQKEGEESRKVVQQINQARPDILVVGFGMPVQEFWIEKHYNEIQACAILPAGSMIDYTAGRKGFAPKWMANNGMEWLYRFFQEPGRLWKRYLIGNPLFMFRVFSVSLRKRK